MKKNLVAVLAILLGLLGLNVFAQSVCPVALNPCNVPNGAIGQLYSLLIDTGSSSTTADLLVVKSAGVTTFRIPFTGIPQTAGSVRMVAAADALTASTMTPIIVGEGRQVLHAYGWTNAMVVALGASLTGDINCCVLPAKTRVMSAIVVIDTPDSSANALTVSCGDTGAGATNYILAADAKAAANTVYGDAISGAETGTSLFDATAKWVPVYMPSYTATTTVSCRFTKTTTNLNTVVGSTGRIILTTALLP